MIGGNVYAELMKQSDTGFNEIGERVRRWSTYVTLKGWLDYSSGESNYTYNAKLQQTTHVFVCDYTEIDMTAEQRMYCNGRFYDVILVDDPMELHEHIEIFLKVIE